MQGLKLILNELKVENEIDYVIIEHNSDSYYDLEKSYIESNESDEDNFEEKLLENKPKPIRPKKT